MGRPHDGGDGDRRQGGMLDHARRAGRGAPGGAQVLGRTGRSRSRTGAARRRRPPRLDAGRLLAGSGAVVRSARHEPARAFFLDTVQRALREPYRLLFAPRTSLAALEAVAAGSAPPGPAGLVLHTSRCGSTLVCRCSAPCRARRRCPSRCPSTRRCARRSQRRRTRALAAVAAGRARRRRRGRQARRLERSRARGAARGAARRTVDLPLPRSGRGARVTGAHARAARWCPACSPAELFGLDMRAASRLRPRNTPRACSAAICESALEQLDDDCRLIAYADLPDAVLTEIAPHFGLPAGEVELALMRAAAKADAKRPYRALRRGGGRPPAAGVRGRARRGSALGGARRGRARAAKAGVVLSRGVATPYPSADRFRQPRRGCATRPAHVVHALDRHALDGSARRPARGRPDGPGGRARRRSWPGGRPRRTPWRRQAGRRRARAGARGRRASGAARRSPRAAGRSRAARRRRRGRGRPRPRGRAPRRGPGAPGRR